MNDLRRWMNVLCEGETAWHGSNETFKRFAVRYIGTGQGQHKYGWGFYFSADKAVAERYAALLIGGPKAINHRAEIPPDDQFLDWDAPIAQQPEPIRAALLMSIPDGDDAPPIGRKAQWQGLIDHGWAGVDAYRRLAKLLGSKAASKTLDRLGIVGNKYLGRDDLDGHGTRNYVVFNPKRIKLLGSELVPASVPRGGRVGPYRLTDITETLRFETDMPNAAWAARQREWKNTPDIVHDNPEVEQLKHILLRYGGWAANIDRDDPDLTNIIARGIIMTGRGSKIMKGKPVNCHRNAATLWRDGAARICTGYALSRDGLWRQHSWGRMPNQQVIETTVRRLAYFGFVLDDEEAEDFVKHNPPC